MTEENHLDMVDNLIPWGMTFCDVESDSEVRFRTDEHLLSESIVEVYDKSDKCEPLVWSRKVCKKWSNQCQAKRSSYKRKVREEIYRGRDYNSPKRVKLCRNNFTLEEFGKEHMEKYKKKSDKIDQWTAWDDFGIQVLVNKTKKLSLDPSQNFFKNCDGFPNEDDSGKKMEFEFGWV